jgi:two-component system cell cycle response regulator
MRGWAERRERGLAPAQVQALDRFRIMQGIRAVAVVLVVLCVWLAPGTLSPYPGALLPLSLGLTITAVVAGIVVVTRPETAPRVLRAMVVVDATYVTVGAHVSGGTSSPLQYAILLHLGAVTLLASARTGLVLALLDTLLVTALRAGVSAGWWPDTTHAAGAPPGQQLVVFLVVLWIVALTTAALSVGNRRELRRRRHDLDALSLLTERVERAARPAAVAQLLLDAVVSTYGLKRGVVLSVEDDRLALLASSAGPTDASREGSSALVARAHREGTLLVPRPVASDEPWLGELLPGTGSLVVVPLMADDRPLGALVVEPGGSNHHQRRLVVGLERSAAYGALALRNARLMELVQRQASTDGLTKIANRRAFEGTLERELSRATRNAEYVSLVMVDIDFFKELNDTLGHQAGDEVLRNAAARLAQECREFDTPARYGGEEFAIVLPGCGPEQAREIAERLRLAVCSASGSTPVTASAGVATFPAHAGDAESLVGAADEALYVSKRSGRDRTTASEGIAPEEQVNALIRRAVRERLRARDGQGPDGGEDPALLPLSDR